MARESLCELYFADTFMAWSASRADEDDFPGVNESQRHGSWRNQEIRLPTGPSRHGGNDQVQQFFEAVRPHGRRCLLLAARLSSIFRRTAEHENKWRHIHRHGSLDEALTWPLHDPHQLFCAHSSVSGFIKNGASFEDFAIEPIVMGQPKKQARRAFARSKSMRKTDAEDVPTNSRPPARRGFFPLECP